MKLFTDKMNSGSNWKSTVSADISQRNGGGLKMNNQTSNVHDGGSSSNNRLAMKLMNIHASVDQPGGNQLLGPVHKEMQKKIALDDCTNFL